MIEIVKLLNELSLEETLVSASLSQPRKEGPNGPVGDAPYERLTLKPILIKESLVFQLEGFKGPQAFHENLEPSAAVTRLCVLARDHYKQMKLSTTAFDYDLLINRQGKASVKRNPSPKARDIASHNRKKQYLLEDGIPVDYLIYLGVMDESGKVFKKKYDKFKQLNRFLEFVDDCMPALLERSQESGRALRILDFGCGKAYLTFALYHYLVQVQGLEVEIVGLDLKTDVIAYCNGVAQALHYDRLKFLEGDIKDYEQTGGVDMVVTLHACDNATDEALAKAVDWQAKVILSVPCCQHEFFRQLENTEQMPMLKHGILRDKLNSLVTDSLRGLALEALGYEVQMLEFIDMTHTPKNVLIRAFLSAKDLEISGAQMEDAANSAKSGEGSKGREAFDQFKAAWGLKETFIEKSLKAKGLF